MVKYLKDALVVTIPYNYGPENVLQLQRSMLASINWSREYSQHTQDEVPYNCRILEALLQPTDDHVQEETIIKIPSNNPKEDREHFVWSLVAAQRWFTQLKEPRPEDKKHLYDIISLLEGFLQVMKVKM